MREIEILPSLICADLFNLDRDLKELENIGIKTLHVDILDGHFSPSLPIGLEMIQKIKENIKMDFDVHIMSTNNEWFINEVIKIGAKAICFHYETSLHVDRLMNLIKKVGMEVGIALNPATSLSTLDYILEYCDNILLMLINPGFAGDKNEKQVPYALKKVIDLRNLIDKNNYKTKIIVDGRVSMQTIEGLVKAGADKLVAGSTSLFLKSNSLAENKKQIEQIIKGINK
ncbi:ribulose-phosphate 3-epimerase [uncultured Brachyspira sp.]|uniref:ribulose-phosphate 3-epimerase n=1 Tax=uncultured Brachyspira sp. TaxID=221953 RepID=UPI0025FE75EC|nr:ribulose-phosphate 3-epimerase [uncultured Brachyspira sp.]